MSLFARIFRHSAKIDTIHVQHFGLPDWSIRDLSHGTEYTGFFLNFTPAGEIFSQVLGRVIEWPGLPVDVYLFDPPQSLRRHGRGHCLQLLKPDSNWYKLHWEHPARTFDEARAYVEMLLAESILS